MKRHVFADKITGEVKMVIDWADDRDLPSDYPIPEGLCEVTTTEDINLDYTCDINNKAFYVLDVTDNELLKARLQAELDDLETKLSTWQEDTWAAMGVDETKLPQIWQDRLAKKRTLRVQLNEL